MSGVGSILHTLGGPDWVDRVLLILVLVFLGIHIVTKRLESLDYVQPRHEAIMTFRGVVLRERKGPRKGKARLYFPGYLRYIPGLFKLHQANMMWRIRQLEPLTRMLHGGWWRIEVAIRYEVDNTEKSLLTSEQPDEHVMLVCSAALQKLNLTAMLIESIPHQLPAVLKEAATLRVGELGFRLVDVQVTKVEPTFAQQVTALMGTGLLTVPLPDPAQNNGHGDTAHITATG
jgi:hypothetical protein